VGTQEGYAAMRDYPPGGYAIGRPERPVQGGPGESASLPSTWREHWFEHTQLVTLYHFDGHAAVYLDGDVDHSQARWLPRHISRIWQYAKAAYGGGFGPDPRIYSIHHAGRYGGGHPAYYYDPSHDYRNVSDCGLGAWREEDHTARDMPIHEIAHVVESANNGSRGSPAFGIWRDSKWAEFFMYDVYQALGLPREAQRLHRLFSGQTDDFPKASTAWFRDWFYPLWRDCGQADVMARFFRLLALHFPTTDGKRYARDLNWGEYVHFTSGAAGADLQRLAARAFGWLAGRSAELDRARATFPLITY
jgi:hypothetical protein